MSSTHHANLRTSPPHARKIAVKAARPAPLGASKTTIKGHSKSKKSLDKSKEKGEEETFKYQDFDDDMPASFLQFCVTCDRQILVPNNSLLYCSERCKRMDAEHVSDYQTYTSLHSPTSSEEDEALGSKKAPLVKRAVPTPRPMLSARIPPDAHEGKSDLDPTEWKPSDPYFRGWKPKLSHRPSSDASKYLGQFHRTPPNYESPRRLSPSRPVAVQARTLGSVPMAAPSLSATPSTSSTSSGDSVAASPYDFGNHAIDHRRPMTSTATKSIDLVTPKKLTSARSVPAKPTITVNGSVSEDMSLSGDLSYEKNWKIFDPRGPGSGSLSSLLGKKTLQHKGAM
ncbi:MAG: hypothetical protein Q9183_002447 [Haloplaca sp. 2 TL-2023]